MRFSVRYNRISIGIISGILFPLLTGLIIFIFSHGDQSLDQYLARLVNSNIVTHSISLCVFSNILIFLGFNRLDMLKASKGVLAITIIWALLVLGIKLFG